MARRNSNTEATSNDEAQATPTEDAPIDLSGFESAVNEAVSGADSDSGEVNEDALKSVTEAYRALDGVKAKNAAKDHIETSMKEAILGDNGPLAKSYVLIRNSMTAGSSKAPATPKDPTEAFVAKVAVLMAAQEVLNATVPEGVNENWVEQAETLATTLAADAQKVLEAGDDAEVEVGPDARKVVKLASGRGTGGGGSTFTGTRRDVGKHIAEAFADQPSGTFLSVNEIVKFKSTEYGSDSPSSGAVSARLFPKSGNPKLPEGISAAHPDGQSRGAVKA